MKFLSAILCIILFVSTDSVGQTYALSKGQLTIRGEGVIDTVEAFTQKIKAQIDTKKRSISFNAPLESLVFEDPIIWTFLSNRILNSRKFPNIIFIGNYKHLRRSERDNSEIEISGKLELNGVSKKITSTAGYNESDRHIEIKLTALINLSDHEIEIPMLIRDAVAHMINVSLESQFLKKENIGR